MHALIVSCNGEDYVHVSGSLTRLEQKAIDIINNELELSKPSWENFGALEVEKLLNESLLTGDADTAMELFAEVSDTRGEIVYMRIVRAELDMDA